MTKLNSGAHSALQAVVGRRYGPYLAFHPVSYEGIWQWVEAFDDRNPLYSDKAFSKAAGFADIQSPPSMIQSWCLPTIARKYPQGSANERPYEVLDIASEHGFPGNVAVAYDQRFLKPVIVGDRLHYFVEPTHISEEKSTRLGTGHFVTCLEEYRNQNDEVVYESRTTYFKFKGGELSSETMASNEANALANLRPPEEYESEVTWQKSEHQLAKGALLGELHIPVSSSRIAVCALASRDWMPVHHSREAAMEQGQPDIFMNILTTGGLVGRFLTDWAGAGATIRSLKFNLGTPNYPGDKMIIGGAIDSLTTEGDKTIAIVNFQGNNSLGPHVSGQAEVVIPASA